MQKIYCSVYRVTVYIYIYSTTHNHHRKRRKMNQMLQSSTVEREGGSKLYQIHLSPVPVTTNMQTVPFLLVILTEIRARSLSISPISFAHIFQHRFSIWFSFTVFGSAEWALLPLMNLELCFYLLVCCRNFLKNEKISSQELLIKHREKRRKKSRAESLLLVLFGIFFFSIFVLFKIWIEEKKRFLLKYNHHPA